MPWVGQIGPPPGKIKLRIEVTAKFRQGSMLFNGGVAGRSGPEWGEAVFRATHGDKQGGGIAVVGFKRSTNQIPQLSPLCSEWPQIGCLEERSSSKGEQVGEKVVGDVSLFEIPARTKCARCLLISWFYSGDVCLSCKFARTFVTFSVPRSWPKSDGR